MVTPVSVNVDPATLFGIVTAALALAGASIRVIELLVSRKLFGDRGPESDFEDIRQIVRGMVNDVEMKLTNLTEDLHGRISRHIKDVDIRLRKLESDVAVLKDRSARGED